jgi:hypothetical protein
LPKVTLAGLRLTPGAVPVPLKVTVCVLPVNPLLLSAMVRVPLSVPVVVGANVTEIVQESPAAKLLPQLLVWPKLALGVMPVTVSAEPPVLLRVTSCGPLVVPRF